MKILTQNRRARHDYFIDSTVEAGIILQGSEVKATRMGRMQIREAFIDLRNGEPWLIGAHIGEYPHAKFYVHEATRDRKLLLHAEEIRKLERRVREKGYTLVPVDVHLSERGFIKITIGLARGKKQIDKRETIKKRDQERDLRREMNRRE
jgi:SsrA-binding protein